MSTISAGSFQRPSPRDALQQTLASAIKSGSIKETDKDALSSALDSIDSSLKSQGEANRVSGKRPSPGDLKAAVSDLIDGQVQSGKLTEDQASELKDVFAKTFEKGGPGKAGGPPPAGQDGPPPPPPDEASSTSDTSDLKKLFEDFLKTLKEQKSSGYNVSGTTTGSNNNALLLDLIA